MADSRETYEEKVATANRYPDRFKSYFIKHSIAHYDELTPLDREGVFVVGFLAEQKEWEKLGVKDWRTQNQDLQTTVAKIGLDASKKEAEEVAKLRMKKADLDQRVAAGLEKIVEIAGTAEAALAHPISAKYSGPRLALARLIAFCKPAQTP